MRYFHPCFCKANYNIRFIGGKVRKSEVGRPVVLTVSRDKSGALNCWPADKHPYLMGTEMYGYHLICFQDITAPCLPAKAIRKLSYDLTL
jgi:hypothetical protein